MIPTATQLIANKFPNHDGVFVLRNIEEFMIQFAQLHVKEALKQASEKANTKYEELPILGEVYNIDKETILNAYSLENIK